MSTLDQRIGAQAGQAIAYANDAALAIAREVTRQQRQIVQELRTPVIVETPADRLAKKEQDDRDADPAKATGDDTASGGPKTSKEKETLHLDVRI